MKPEKIEWVDALKCIGIVAVILGHINSPFGGFIFSWHMPLFFMMAGFFIKTTLEPARFFVKEFKRLMIPYFIFSALALILESLKRLALHREHLNFKDELNGIFIWMDMDALINTYAFVLWFLPALFIARYFTYLILKYIRFKILQIFIILALFLVSFNFQLPFAIDNGLNALLFVYVGYFLLNSNQKIWPFSIFILLLVCMLYGFPELNMSQKQYGDILLNIVWSVSITSVLILLVATVNKSSRLIVLWGRNTMLLFILHPYTNNIASVLATKLAYSEWYFKLSLSLILLQALIFLKDRYSHWKLFQYV